MNFRVAIDSGGTFTDGVVMDESGEARVAKSHTTPKDLTIGTMNCIEKLASLYGLTPNELLSRTGTIVHGTTMATNVVATKSGAKMGTITTKGLKHLITFPHVPKSEWKEQPVDMYDFRLDAPTGLTRNYLMTEVEERVSLHDVIPLNEETVRDAVRYLKKHEVKSIAVMLMFSFIYPEHEMRIGEIIEEEYPGVYVALSSKVLPVMGETDRWSTTMFSAYVAPAVTDYVKRIKVLLEKKGFKGELSFLQSNGGIATPEIVIENPATLLLSGPASGPSLGCALGLTCDSNNVLSVDMGGTSFDVGVVHDGIVDIVEQQVIDAKKYCLPSVDITAVGAGGGSIAYIDPSGRLQVGPKSAGANPGPVCYDQGGNQPTVTDADVVLGYIDPNFFLGGEVKLRKDLAEKAIKEKIADPLKLSVPEAAAAIYEIINVRMANGTNVNFSKRGYDPRDFSMCAAGGAAPVHAVEVMKELGLKKLIIPKMAPTYCAYGMLFSDLKHDFTRSYYGETDKADFETINTQYEMMEESAREMLRREGIAEKDMIIEKFMQIGYYGQFRFKTIKITKGDVAKESMKTILNDFHKLHQDSLGYSDPKYPTVIVRLHLSGIAKVSKPHFKSIENDRGKDMSKALKGTRNAYFTGQGFTATNVYDGDMLRQGDVIKGPGIIEEKYTTFVIPPGTATNVDQSGNYIMNLEEA